MANRIFKFKLYTVMAIMLIMIFIYLSEIYTILTYNITIIWKFIILIDTIIITLYLVAIYEAYKRSNTAYKWILIAVWANVALLGFWAFMIQKIGFMPVYIIIAAAITDFTMNWKQGGYKNETKTKNAS